MSDQDFFFDEEDEKQAEAEKPKSRSTSSKTTGGASSSTSRTSASRSTASKPKPANATPEPEAPASMFDQPVTLAVAALMAVIALLLGIILGLFIGQSRATADIQNTPSAAPSAGTASPLTPQQLNGPLPAGHPSVNGGPSSAATGSKTTTPAK